MGSPEFKAIFSELKGFINYPEFKDTIIHLVNWGSSAEYHRFRGLSATTIKQMYDIGDTCLGSTYPLLAYKELMEHVSHPDLILLLTDCQFTSSSSFNTKNEDPKFVSYMKRIIRKTVYVSVDRSSSYQLRELDPNYEKRLVELSPNEARESDDI
jgi:hypothetical protein